MIHDSMKFNDDEMVPLLLRPAARGRAPGNLTI